MVKTEGRLVAGPSLLPGPSRVNLWTRAQQSSDAVSHLFLKNHRNMNDERCDAFGQLSALRIIYARRMRISNFTAMDVREKSWAWSQATENARHTTCERDSGLATRRI